MTYQICMNKDVRIDCTVFFRDVRRRASVEVLHAAVNLQNYHGSVDVATGGRWVECCKRHLYQNIWTHD